MVNMRQPGKYETLRYQLANMRQILLTWGFKSQIANFAFNFLKKVSQCSTPS